MLKLLLSVLSLVTLVTISSSANAKPLSDRVKLANSSSATKLARPRPISQWKFVNANEDLGIPHSQKAEGDWNRVAIISKPYRSSFEKITRPFAQWGFENLKRDLGDSYTSKQAQDWNTLVIATKPYR